MYFNIRFPVNYPRMMPVSRAKGRLAKGRLVALGLAAFCITILFGSCARRLGWGILLWSSEDPPIPSGTMLPVYIRSNIDHVWVVGIPENFRRPEYPVNKFEVPLAQLEFVGSKKKAREWIAGFAPLALSYAETLQDGLPIREDPDNGSRRVYRLRIGEIIKILELVEGNPAMSTTGTPLPGDWYRVLTEDGSRGYCFSYRLRLFEDSGGHLAAAQTAPEETEDPELEQILSMVWSPESYETMLNNRRINLEEFARRWQFSPGLDTGIAQIYLPDMERSFPYTRIRAAGTRAWRFEGSSLEMRLRSDTTLELQFTDTGGTLRILPFAALPSTVDDLIAQESARREGLYQRIYDQGPVFNSINYGLLSFREDERFTWTGYDLLVPRIIPASVPGNGRVSMDIFLGPSLADHYDGAFSLRFDGIGSAGTTLRFMYTLDNQGFRIEYIPPVNMDGTTVLRRTGSPTVIYFFRADQSLQPNPSLRLSEPPPFSPPESSAGGGFPAWQDLLPPDFLELLDLPDPVDAFSPADPAEEPEEMPEFPGF